MFEKIVKKIEKILSGKDAVVIVAISGYCGSGKTTLAKRLSDNFDSAPAVTIDDFITQARDHRSKDWSTFDRERFRSEILEVAQPNSKLAYTQFRPGEMASGHKGTKKQINIDKLLIVEGVSIFTPELMKYYDLSVWIDCPIEKAVERGKQRGRDEESNNSWYLDYVWAPNDIDFEKMYSPSNQANIIYPFDS